VWAAQARATPTRARFSGRRRSAFEQAGYAVVIADHYNEGARRDAHAEPLTNRQGWERSQSAHFWKAIYATACGVPQLVDFALRTYGNDARIVAYGQSMGGDCFLTGAHACICGSYAPAHMCVHDVGCCSMARAV
jgi:dienelactone hydrolase